MIDEVNKSQWYELLTKAYQRAKNNKKILAEVLNVSNFTVKTWLNRPESKPRKVEELIPKLEAYLNSIFMSGPNPIARERMWQSMRCLNTFSTIDIASTADIKVRSVQKFLSTLHKAGYVRLHSNGRKRIWHLIFNTGPKAPEVGRNREFVFDSNLNREVWRKEVAA